MQDYPIYDSILSLPDGIRIMDENEFHFYHDFMGVSKWFNIDYDILADKLINDTNFNLAVFIQRIARLKRIYEYKYEVIITRFEENIFQIWTNNKLVSFLIRAILGQPLYDISIKVNYRYDRDVDKKYVELYSKISEWLGDIVEKEEVLQHPYISGSSFYSGSGLQTILTTQDEIKANKVEKRFEKRIAKLNSKKDEPFLSGPSIRLEIRDTREYVKTNVYNYR